MQLKNNLLLFPEPFAHMKKFWMIFLSLGYAWTEEGQEREVEK
jgi:hypothetical protein